MNLSEIRALIIMTPLCETQHDILAQFFHIWIIDSASNRELAKELRSHLPKDTNASVTIFDKSNDVCSIISDVEVHHGAAAFGTPISSIEARGATLTQAVRDDLLKLGFKGERISDFSFRATRCNAHQAT